METSSPRRARNSKNGVPVATFAIGEAGAKNAALFAVAMLALDDPTVAARLALYRKSQTDRVLALELPKPAPGK